MNLTAVTLVLPTVWATADVLVYVPPAENPAEGPAGDPAEDTDAPPDPGPKRVIAAYRRYTEAILRRYQRMSMEAGRAPSLLGREMFRGRVTSYEVHSFEDVVIFVHDVERCIDLLNDEQRYFIDRFALQEFTQDEGTHLTGLPRRTIVRRYGEALDRLSRLLLAKGLLEPLIACQELKNRNSAATRYM